MLADGGPDIPVQSGIDLHTASHVQQDLAALHGADLPADGLPCYQGIQNRAGLKLFCHSGSRRRIYRA